MHSRLRVDPATIGKLKSIRQWVGNFAQPSTLSEERERYTKRLRFGYGIFSLQYLLPDGTPCF